jgi:hypothetical protein
MLLGHKVAWAIYHGYWPYHELDHINGVRTDNRIENLRASTRRDNMLNQHKKKGRDKDLPIGVYRVKRAGGIYFAASARFGKKQLKVVASTLETAIAVLPSLREKARSAHKVTAVLL